jgi:hypothetical protein
MRHRSLIVLWSALGLAMFGCSSDDSKADAGAAADGGGEAGPIGDGGADSKVADGSAGATDVSVGGAVTTDAATSDATPGGLATLGGAVPLVIGHRGLPGLYPEETLPSYEGAANAGADSLEEDLHLTKDCVLVARHNPWLSDNTNVTEVAMTNPAVAARKRTVPGVMVNVAYSLATYGGPAAYLSDRTDPNDPSRCSSPSSSTARTTPATGRSPTSPSMSSASGSAGPPTTPGTSGPPP